ncbi:uncharacterized protein YjbI with pentapeptide repeats [Allocatelliglobosispora scoriae]|uniref:Uncharacterized protein YjbI with pentapeptide repeats n=1 Tax=Allocatelliglobosispora scoriae TaxID=643052 RepID=A0A841BHP6_9ACTN|nr:pentapeptide repeat-containing protein [Allocatelliglobosispora scoriae]MBB5866696.1 uncharacterized protein YjbI with pentapeptide repeats [Allocatelliglobosispora scoriae]
MDVRKIRETTIALLDEPDLLDPVAGVPRHHQAVSEAVISGDVWARAELVGVSVSRSWFLDADLSSAKFEGGAFDRCVFRRCSMIGMRWDGLAAKDVIMENCRLDYAFLAEIKTTGPIAFLGCSLTDTTIKDGKLGRALFDCCKLAGVTFDGPDLRGADLRGNDISGLTGATALRGVTLSAAQIPTLTELLLQELNIKIKSEPLP